MDLHCLYDSDSFIVVHTAPNAPGEGIEICNKQEGTSAYLTGRMCDYFKLQCQEWKVRMPEAEEVECYCEAMMVNAVPMRTH